jgi:hypothetical protein
VLHEFKTKGKYDTIKKEFSDNVSRLIRAWKSEKKIKNGDLLLPRKRSSIISKMNSVLDVDLGGGGSVGVNWIRHSVASTAAANANLSDDDLLDLIMLHVLSAIRHAAHGLNVISLLIM